jgi:hypothetical protein
VFGPIVGVIRELTSAIEPLIAAVAKSGSGPAKAKNTANIFQIAKDILYAVQHCGVREGLLLAAENNDCPPVFAANLRNLATGVAATVNPEFVNQPVRMTVAYANQLLRALETLSTGTGPAKVPSPAAILVVANVHWDIVARRLESNGDLYALDPILLASDVGGAVQAEASRVQLAAAMTTASNKRPYNNPTPDTPSGSGYGRWGRGSGRGLLTGGRGMPPPPGGPPRVLSTCREYARGTCTRGTSCRFSHGP